MKLLNRPPDKVREVITLYLGKDEDILILVAGDIKDEHSFGERWIVVTAKRVLLVGDGDKEQLKVEDIPIASLQDVRAEPLIGYNSLILEGKNQEKNRIYYSHLLSHQFAEVAKGIQQLIKGRPLEISAVVEKIRCPKCGRLLEERGGKCIYCVSRGTVAIRVIRYLRLYKRKAGFLILMTFAGTLVQLIPPHLTKVLIDKVLTPKEDIRLLKWLVLGMVIAAVIYAIVSIIRGWLVAWVGAKITQDIRQELFHHLEMLSLKFYDKRQVGAIMSRVTHDAEMLYEFLAEGVPYLLTNAVMLIGVAAILLVYNWRLALLTLIPVPCLFFGGMFFWRSMRRLFHRWWRKWEVFTARLNEVLSGVRVVKAFAQEMSEIRSFDKRAQEIFEATFRADRLWLTFFPTMGFLTTIGILIAWYVGGREVFRGNLSLGTLMAFIAYLWMFYGPLQWLAQVNNWMTRAFAGAERIFEVIDSTPESYDSPDSVPMPNIRGNIEFRGVYFSYEVGKPVLKDIDLKVREGEMIGLVGKSGVGKSTLVNLVCRFYETKMGEILVDGVDIRDIKLKDLRSQIGIVLQEPFLFNGTIAENIGYGKPEATVDEIIEAARAANAHDFIVAKPDGYDTKVGERGTKLSVGEKQRISVARAILHDPKILILDEATSSVDTETEKKIQEATKRLVESRTTLAIAHRLSTLKNADRLVVLDEGKIVEVGTHDELMEKKGIYYNLVKMQREISKIEGIGG